MKEEGDDDDDNDDDDNNNDTAEEKVKKTNEPFSQPQRCDFCSFVIGSTFLPSEMSMIKCYGYIIQQEHSFKGWVTVPVSDFCVVNYCLFF